MFRAVKLKKIIFFLVAVAALIIGGVCWANHFIRPEAEPSDSITPQVYMAQAENISTEENSTDNGAAAEQSAPPNSVTEEKKFIKWVDFDVSYEAMNDALKLDTESHDTDCPLKFTEMLAYLGARYGGDFSRYKKKDMDALAEKLKGGKTMQELTTDMKYYDYYLEAYSAVMGEYVGSYRIEKDGGWEEKYGLKVFSPIAKGYSFSDFDDFGNKRTYGYARRHLGHDLMGSVGTPIVAIESGTIEALGWNQYGGWRIGIRSFDKKRYYYYAHLRKNHPYQNGLKQGDTVKAGDVIGYLGMTGYSSKENVNNIDTPHLHFGIQLIFDESQKEGSSEIWIDCYDITKLLQKNKSEVYKDEEKKEYFRKYNFEEDILKISQGGAE